VGGAELDVEVANDGTTWLRVFQGPIVVHAKGSGREVTVQAGEAITVRPDGSIEQGGGGPRPLRVVVKVTDHLGSVLPEVSFCVFKPGVTPAPGQIRKEDTLILAKTDVRGLYDSQWTGTRIPAGLYHVKAVRPGYVTFEGNMELREGTTPGLAVLSFRLRRP
jgi:hypothetical protein